MILGASRPDQLAATLAADDFQLDAELKKQLDELTTNTDVGMRSADEEHDMNENLLSRASPPAPTGAATRAGAIRRFFNAWRRWEELMDYSPYDHALDRIGQLERRVLELERATNATVAMLDVTVVNVALGDIQREFTSPLSTLVWIVDAYTLTFASLLLLGGTLADWIGAKRAYISGLAIFVLASALCGFATSTSFLIVARLLQVLFPNAKGERLSVHGVQYLLNKHRVTASNLCPSLKHKRVTVQRLKGTSWPWILFKQASIVL